MRYLSFFTLVALALLTPYPLFLFGVFLYLLVYTGYELLLITLVIDSVFGMSTTSFLYTQSVGVLLLLSVVGKPYMSWYTKGTP